MLVWVCAGQRDPCDRPWRLAYSCACARSSLPVAISRRAKSLYLFQRVSHWFITLPSRGPLILHLSTEFYRGFERILVGGGNKHWERFHWARLAGGRARGRRQMGRSRRPGGPHSPPRRPACLTRAPRAGSGRLRPKVYALCQPISNPLYRGFLLKRKRVQSEEQFKPKGLRCVASERR